ncbi:hypothetical protein Bca52824_038336 [Brassica carinata]|uniref:Zinc knuckle CX2CX4HX4C domain-containing protein n=1 Tax=Brassica carinata TaxID=52824 RepID=A0A8X7RPF4_BRACI|nr:hypothetical protein Bca52824_038336 [Brassica carinata]
MIVVIDGAKELCFDATVNFKSGEFYEEEASVLLKYEKLFGLCKLCFKLCHDEDHCPLNPKSPVKKKETKDESESRKEDRARSYKGVVINGDVSNQENLKDQRGYYGKDKGKIGSKKPSSYRTSSRVEEERSRFRNSRWEQPRNQMQDDRNRYQREASYKKTAACLSNCFHGLAHGPALGTKRVQRNLQKVEKSTTALVPHLVSQESNGENINSVEVSATSSMELECGLGDKLEIGKLVIGLERTKELVGNGNDDLKNETMEFDVTGTHVEGKEEFICGGDDFQALTDGEVEEIVMLQEDTRVITDGADELGGNVDHGILAGDDEKKKGARKALFKKTTAVAVGTSKMRFVQTVLSPRKNAPVKTGKRQGEGEGAKQTEDKGPSNPKPTSSKPFN